VRGGAGPQRDQWASVPDGPGVAMAAAGSRMVAPVTAAAAASQRRARVVRYMKVPVVWVAAPAVPGHKVCRERPQTRGDLQVA
jgi:hypothetical protein